MAQFQTVTISDTGYLKLPKGTTAQRPGSPAAGSVRFNTTTQTAEYYTGSGYTDMGNNWEEENHATGGDWVSHVGQYKIHHFTTVGSSTFVANFTGTVEVLVVAGGGGGGGNYGAGGGGGGGGVVHHIAKAVVAGTSYTVTVGAGGAGGTPTEGRAGDSLSHGQRGGNSVFSDITAIGGGGGNASFYVASSLKDGGSGGGGGDFYTGYDGAGNAASPGSGTQADSGGGTGYGNPGGSRRSDGDNGGDGTHAVPHEGGGGGGAGSAGGNGASDRAGRGGDGKAFNITGEMVYYAGGGGGGYYGSQSPADSLITRSTKSNSPIAWGDNSPTPTYQTMAYQDFPLGMAGGLGGGGNGASAYYGVFATSGYPNSGGGGGGGSSNNPNGNSVDQNFSNNAGAGASGIVIVKYKTKRTAIVQTFTEYGTTAWTAPTGVTKVEVLAVGGGGGGGAWVGGGGGGGGYLYRASWPVTPGTSYTVTVGAGGNREVNPGSYTGMPAASNGGNSVFDTLTAVGGGYGGSWTFAAQAGGSGGGQGYNQAAASGTDGQGFPGGTARADSTNGYPSGGGGGAGGPGGSWTTQQSGNGGIGRGSAITGTWRFYGGGGGGGIHGSSSNARPGRGGFGGGGNGHGPSGSNPGAQDGQPNTGGGGGASGNPGGSVSYGGRGGSGIVVIKYYPST